MKDNMTKEEFVWAAHDVLLWGSITNWVSVPEYVFKVWWEEYTIQKCMEECSKLSWKDVIDCYTDLYNTLQKKNADYSPWADAFSNFYMALEFWIWVEDWIKVRMCDKVSRIQALQTKEPDVVWESLVDSWADLGWYLTIVTIYSNLNKWESEKM